MKPTDIARVRMAAQQLHTTSHQTPREMVSHMGAMQAQDYAMCKWAVGIRLPGCTEHDVDKAFDKGEIIRMHVLRPTWHLVAAQDAGWMMALTAPHIKPLTRSLDKQLGITEETYIKSNNIIAKALAGQKSMLREDLVALLEKASLDTAEQRVAHMLFRAEMEGIACTTGHKKPAYTAWENRVKNTRSIPREEALAMLAQRYFTSHGPATVSDFTWWSGLPAKDARHALEMVKGQLIHETMDGETYWFDPVYAKSKAVKDMHLLPAFDEYIISYKNRTAVLDKAHQLRAFTRNGIFKPVVLAGGIGEGVWKRTAKAAEVHLETEFFNPGSIQNAALAKQAQAFGDFLGKKVVLK